LFPLSLPEVRPFAPQARSPALLRAGIFALGLAGFGLRLAFSRAPLWNDEIWSLQNLRGIHGVGGILWGLSHDNNHFLNSIWLYFVSDLAPSPTALRGLSIVAGVLAIPAMAELGARRGAAAGFAAALLTAFSFFQVVYSVEARGYAVATLCLILAYGQLEKAFEAPTSGARFRLAVACGIGFFAHLAFAPAAAALAVIFLLDNVALRRLNPLAALFATVRLFWPAALACAPTLIFLAIGYHNKGGFTIGAFTPFSLSRAIGGLAGLGMMTFGLDPTSFAQTAFALLGLPLLILAAILSLAPTSRKPTYLVMLVVLPVLAVAFKLPNTHVARYFFAASPFLILLAADAYGELFRRGPSVRALALAGLVAALVGDGAALARLAAGEATPWTDALERIAQSPEPTLSSSHDFNVGKSVAYFGEGLKLVPSERICAERPAWRIVETRGDGKAEATLSVGEPNCALPYRLEGVFNRDVPSQLPWALYRAVR
jgi:hypothetical protein